MSSVFLPYLASRCDAVGKYDAMRETTKRAIKPPTRDDVLSSASANILGDLWWLLFWPEIIRADTGNWGGCCTLVRKCPIE